jgi:superfamily I DNA/RNA helicase/CRISPR/Cas system-associated exonuclease Cas4 (RecB family)
MSRLPLDPDPSQAPVVGLDRGAVLVTGPPGSGKTTVLLERFARLVEGGAEPERVSLFLLTRRAVRDARQELVQRMGRSLPDLPVFTAHGFAFRVLGRRFRDVGYDAPPEVLSAPEQYAAVRTLLADADPETWPRFGHLLHVRGFAQVLADFVLRAQERLLTPDALDELVEKQGREEYAAVTRFYRDYLDTLVQQGQVDFAGLLFQAANLVTKDLSPDEAFSHVLVDDYQDVTPATEALLRPLARAADSIVVAADPAGHVFSFRGGTSEPLARVAKTLGCREHVTLARSHRLNGQADGLAALEDPAAPAASTSGSRIEARLFAHPGEEAEAVAHELLRFRVEEDVRWSRMAVILRRYGSYLTGLRHTLARHGIPFVVIAEEAAVASEPANRPVIDFLRLVFRPGRREELIEPVLGSPIGGLDPHQLRRLRRVARTKEMTVLQLVTENSAELPPELRTPVERFRRLMHEAPRIADERGPDGLFFWFWSEAGIPYFRDLVAGGDRPRDVDALSALGDVLTRFVERRPSATIEDYLDTVDAAEFGPDPWLPPEERQPDAVRVISAHRAHGSEVEVALVVGCLEGEFPSLDHRAPLLDIESLVAPKTVSERARERLAEERALFRLAVSRARRMTVLFASHSAGSRNPRSPSRFAQRIGLEWSPPAEEAPPSASLRTMEGDLRRRLRDPIAPAWDRLAVLSVLPKIGAHPVRWWGGRDWTDPGGPLYEDVVRTSYSRLSSLENCPLQYLYAVEMGLDPDETHQMWLGGVVHRIIDQAQKGDIPREEEALHAALDGVWDPTVFPNRAIERRRYADGREMLSRWVNGEQQEPEHSEVGFEFPIDGAVLRGRIDAIFRMSNHHLRVVDYKTSRYPMSFDEARDDLQLAAYYLALKRDPELKDLGEPGYLGLAYLGKISQGTFAVRGVSPRQEEGYEARVETRIRDLLGLIRSERFAPSPTADCQFCSFKPICPVWDEGREVPR